MGGDIRSSSSDVTDIDDTPADQAPTNGGTPTKQANINNNNNSRSSSRNSLKASPKAGNGVKA